MDTNTFLLAMSRGRCSPSGDMAESKYCVFTAPLELQVTRDRMYLEGDDLVLELLYGLYGEPGALRLRQVDTNVILEESTAGSFAAFLADKQVKYIGQLIMYALQFKIRDLSAYVAGCADAMKELEDTLDNRMDNSGTYQLLDFRRSYTQCGNMVIGVKEILTHIDKGYYPMQMQNSYVLQGQVMLEFRFLEERYELTKNTVIKDFDTYTSIVNNNINRSARLLSLISLAGVTLNFMFGSLLAVNPVLGVIGGLAIGGLSVGAGMMYRTNKRIEKPLEPGKRLGAGFHRKKLTAEERIETMEVQKKEE
ncbi:CorA family divalent cation transporter [Flavonifractor porci]|uniref:CorA family divalent cation transporter n=1 Tax=Flavonifractor porci TaxID=3133422 RepID=UPI0030A0A41E